MCLMLVNNKEVHCCKGRVLSGEALAYFFSTCLGLCCYVWGWFAFLFAWSVGSFWRSCFFSIIQ